MQSKEPCISIIAAIGKNRELGFGGDLIWHISDDMMGRFRKLTMGHPVIMGRKTWESMPASSRPLKGRTNVVVTRSQIYAAPGAIIAHSLKEALVAVENAPGAEEIFVVGGAELYGEALPIANRLYLTIIEAEAPADAFFPPYEKEFSKIVAEERRESEGLRYRWITLERVA
ncbi:MAG: dihydrofolate reductase [Minisyncoccia bacterium]